MAQRTEIRGKELVDRRERVNRPAARILLQRGLGMKTLHFTNYWHGTSGGIARFYSALLDAANRHKQEMRLVVPSSETSVEKVGKFGKIYHVAAPRAPLNSRYRVLYPTQFLRAGSPLHRILAEERPDLVEICDKYSLNYLGTVLRLGLLEGLDFKPVVIGQSCKRMEQLRNLRYVRLAGSGLLFVLYALAVLSVFRPPHRQLQLYGRL